MANPLPIVVTDVNGKALTVSGSSSTTQVATPIPVVLTDINGNALNLSAATGTGSVVYSTAPTITGPGVLVTSGSAFSGSVMQILGSGDVEVPVLNVRLDSNSGAAAGNALFVEDFTNFAQSVALVKVQSHNAGDTCPLISLVNAGSGNYINCDSALTVSKAGLLTTTSLAFTNLNSVVPNANISGGITNSNSAVQSQVVVSGTEYYITSSGLTMPATFKGGIQSGSRLTWRITMTKTNAGTGTFQILFKHGTNGSTADTTDATITIGTQSAVADVLTFDLNIVFTSTTAYAYTLVPVQQAASSTGFGLVYPAVASVQTGTVTG